ncbi:hypothetical protein ACXYMU_12830 [Pontibacter sp. CAU 1760]
MKRLSLTLYVALLLTGCSKEKLSPRLTGKFKSDTLGSIQPVRMYTMHGQVTDAATIEKYLQRRNTQNGFDLVNTSFQVPTNFLLLDINKDKQVSVTRAPSAPYKASVISSTATEVLIAQEDSVSIFVPASSNRCDRLSLEVGAHTPAGKFLVPPPHTGYNSGYKFRPQFTVQLKDGQLVLPLLTFGVSNTGNAAACWQATIHMWDTFNPSVLKALQHGDTLVYQLKEIKLLRL